MTALALALFLVGQEPKPSKVTITSPDEPGIPFVLKATVIDERREPLANVKVFVYHTDAAGLYQKPGQNGYRLKGTAWTDRRGVVEFRTIRPAPYPGAKNGEHFHFELSEGGLPNSFAIIEFYDDRPRTKLAVGTGKQGGSATYYTGFAWKEDKEIKGQRLEVELRMKR